MAITRVKDMEVEQDFTMFVLAADSKPTSGVSIGARIYETDTSTWFDWTGTAWVETTPHDPTVTVDTEFANDIKLWKVNFIYAGVEVIDVDYLCSANLHKKRRFFYHIVAYINDQISASYGAVQVVVIGQGSGTNELRMPFVNNSLAHLCIEKIDAGLQ